MTNADDFTDRRLRHDVEIEIEVRHPGGHGSKAMLSNLSLEGCRLKGWFRIGDVLELTIPRIGQVRGQVRWAIGGYAGIRFLPHEGSAGQSAFS